jgi:hypothetical protein
MGWTNIENYSWKGTTSDAFPDVPQRAERADGGDFGRFKLQF